MTKVEGEYIVPAEISAAIEHNVLYNHPDNFVQMVCSLSIFIAKNKNDVQYTMGLLSKQFPRITFTTKIRKSSRILYTMSEVYGAATTHSQLVVMKSQAKLGSMGFGSARCMPTLKEPPPWWNFPTRTDLLLKLIKEGLSTSS